MRGRRVPPPPPFTQATGLNPTVEEMTQAIAGQAGLFMLAYEHEPGCRTPKTQRWQDCTCGDQVDHRLLRYRSEGGAK